MVTASTRVAQRVRESNCERERKLRAKETKEKRRTTRERRERDEACRAAPPFYHAFATFSAGLTNVVSGRAGLSCRHLGFHPSI